ncbi:hypothetical protein FBY41_3595 [Humibacillus xanthopallidus]|uniref:Uncharacterized protein n=1 Tax=Humibacillus xanthopallidus TaxID=412689 RepID=A0A543HIT3_9MICO|nr:hypothetical protein FBY41_3595 [Humibacillus xanthopallidus]
MSARTFGSPGDQKSAGGRVYRTFGSPGDQNRADRRVCRTFRNPGDQMSAGGRVYRTFRNAGDQNRADRPVCRTFRNPGDQMSAGGRVYRTFGHPGDRRCGGRRGLFCAVRSGDVDRLGWATGRAGQLTVSVLPETVTVLGVSPVGAGPETGSPVVMSKWLWWHGQTIWLPSKDATVQPW